MRTAAVTGSDRSGILGMGRLKVVEVFMPALGEIVFIKKPAGGC
jgi:hypothetical protein